MLQIEIVIYMVDEWNRVVSFSRTGISTEITLLNHIRIEPRRERKIAAFPQKNFRYHRKVIVIISVLAIPNRKGRSSGVVKRTLHAHLPVGHAQFKVEAHGRRWKEHAHGDSGFCARQHLSLSLRSCNIQVCQKTVGAYRIGILAHVCT